MKQYKVIDGNLLDAKNGIICHQVNCQGKMNSGVAKAIREKYPRVYLQYLEFVDQHKTGKINEPLLGKVQFVTLNEYVGSPMYIVNMFAQDNYGYDGKQYTSVEAFKKCLEAINKVCVGCEVSFPWKIGCVRGGADWDTVLNLICETLNNVRTIKFYRLDRG